MKRLFALLVLALALGPIAAQAQDGHEYSPLVEKTVNYKNWTLNDLKDNKPVDLRSLVQGKKLVMLVYFAPWCPNWRNEAPVAARLYEKYKDQGFTVIGVSEYGGRDAVSTFLDQPARLTRSSASRSRARIAIRLRISATGRRQETHESGDPPGTSFSSRQACLKPEMC
jgi:thiol-disulfide isomerase/thioredoxin